jgi:hypothetical protein
MATGGALGMSSDFGALGLTLCTRYGYTPISTLNYPHGTPEAAVIVNQGKEITVKSRSLLVRLALLLVLLALTAEPTLAKEAPYMTGLTRWRAADGDFAAWQFAGVTLDLQDALRLDAATAQSEDDPYVAGSYNGHNFYNGASYKVGEAVSPIVLTPFAFTEAIASWNADTPTGTWVETLIRAQVGGLWTKWYNLGVWAAGTGTVERHSVSGQGDADGYVTTDTLVLSGKKVAADAFQVKLRLFSTTGSPAPSVRLASVAYSTTPTKKVTLAPGDPANWPRLLAVPECSQMVYPDGGEVWCSPTSTSMVLGYYGFDAGPCAPRVRAAVDGVYDWLYEGHGNWPFNTAYAATFGLEAYVARFTSLRQAEAWVAAGAPVVVSFAWGNHDLAGAAIPASNGHLAVLVGFDAAGNPIINDPAAATDGAVQRAYDRAEFESLWLEHSGGTVYLIFPVTMTPPNIQ